LIRRHGDMGPEREVRWLCRGLLPQFRQVVRRTDFCDVFALSQRTRETEGLLNELQRAQAHFCRGRPRQGGQSDRCRDDITESPESREVAVGKQTNKPEVFPLRAVSLPVGAVERWVIAARSVRDHSGCSAPDVGDGVCGRDSVLVAGREAGWASFCPEEWATNRPAVLEAGYRGFADRFCAVCCRAIRFCPCCHRGFTVRFCPVLYRNPRDCTYECR